MGLAKFLVYTTVGSVIWNVGLAYIGWRFGEQWERALGLLHQLNYVVAAGVLVLGVAAYVWWRKSRRHAPGGPSDLPESERTG